MNKIIIEVKEINGKLLLKTDSENYEKDIELNRDLLKGWHYAIEVKYRYEDGTQNGFIDINTSHPREVIRINDRDIYANYTHFFEDKYSIDNTPLSEYLIRCFNEDFETSNKIIKPQAISKEFKKYINETSKPINTKINPVLDNIEEELLDD